MNKLRTNARIYSRFRKCKLWSKTWVITSAIELSTSRAAAVICSMVIEVPIRPVNLRFLQGKYGFSKVYKLSRRHPFDYLLMEMLVPKQRSWAPLEAEGNPVLSVELPDDSEFSYRVHLPMKSARMFNKFVYELMKSEFVSYVQALVDIALYDIDEAIYHFIEKYSFTTEELSFETLKQHYYRERKKEESRLVN